MTVVVDHATAKVVWMADGHGKDVLHRFFDDLGRQRTARLTHISADGAAWIAHVLAERATGAVRVMDPPGPPQCASVKRSPFSAFSTSSAGGVNRSP